MRSSRRRQQEGDGCEGSERFKNSLRTPYREIELAIPFVRQARWRLHGHCQSKFYTACSRTRAGGRSTGFAHESPMRSVGFDAENRLYLFALTVPLGELVCVAGGAWAMRFSYWAIELMISARLVLSVVTMRISVIAPQR